MADNQAADSLSAAESTDELVVAALAGQIIGPADAQFVVAQWRDPGSPPGPPRLIAPLHVHHSDDEAWYVLEGRLRFTLGEREVEATAGGAVFAPHGTYLLESRLGTRALSTRHDAQYPRAHRRATYS